MTSTFSLCLTCSLYESLLRCLCPSDSFYAEFGRMRSSPKPLSTTDRQSVQAGLFIAKFSSVIPPQAPTSWIIPKQHCMLAGCIDAERGNIRSRCSVQCAAQLCPYLKTPSVTHRRLLSTRNRRAEDEFPRFRYC